MFEDGLMDLVKVGSSISKVIQTFQLSDNEGNKEELQWVYENLVIVSINVITKSDGIGITNLILKSIKEKK